MSDGMVERANCSIKDQLAKFLYTEGGEWGDYLWRATPGDPSEYATSVRQRLYCTFDIVSDNIAMAGAQQKYYNDRHIRHNVYTPVTLCGSIFQD